VSFRVVPTTPIAFAATIGVVLAGCAGRAGSSAAGAEPAPRPAAEPPVVASFAYAPGTYRYQVANDAVIERTDGTDPRRDQITTATYLTYTLGGSGVQRRIAGTVDSFTVVGGPAGGPATARPLPKPLHFRGILDQTQGRVTFTAVPPTDCRTPAGALLVLARELLAALPPTVRSGLAWRDSSTASVCRGDIPLTSHTTHRYEVAGSATFAGVPAVRVRRTSESTVDGTAVRAGQPVSIAARGTGEADLFFDAGAGRFLGGTGESTTDFTIVSGGATQRFRQAVRQRTSLVAARP
jgi:hypothetical protein